MKTKIQIRQWLPAALMVMAAALGSACSQSGTPTSPSSLSSTSTASPSAPAAPSATGATIIGQVSGTSSTSSASTAMRPQGSAGLTVTVAGTNISTTVDGSGNFTLSGVPPGDVTLQFTGSGTNATITLSGLTAGQTIQITVTINGSQASFDEGGHGQNSSVELEGLIQSIDVAGSTLVVDGVTVSVSSATTITHGSTTLTLSQLQVGQRVHVRGTNQNGTVAASTIMLQDETPPSQQQTSVSGAIAAAPTGTCPALTFTVGSTTVTTSSTTDFDGAACAALAAGMNVDVEGIETGTTLAATHVTVPQTDVQGTLAAAPTGTCPAVAFTVGNSAVTTSASTRFEGGACTDLAAGSKVDVKGTAIGTSLDAAQVSFEGKTGGGDGH
jgi:Domain of unknown function (DUF5666)